MNNPLKSPLLSRWPYLGRCPNGANSLNEPIRPYIKGEENFVEVREFTIYGFKMYNFTSKIWINLIILAKIRQEFFV